MSKKHRIKYATPKAANHAVLDGKREKFQVRRSSAIAGKNNLPLCAVKPLLIIIAEDCVPKVASKLIQAAKPYCLMVYAQSTYKPSNAPIKSVHLI